MHSSILDYAIRYDLNWSNDLLRKGITTNCIVKAKYLLYRIDSRWSIHVFKPKIKINFLRRKSRFERGGSRLDPIHLRKNWQHQKRSFFHLIFFWSRSTSTSISTTSAPTTTSVSTYWQPITNEWNRFAHEVDLKKNREEIFCDHFPHSCSRE